MVRGWLPCVSGVEPAEAKAEPAAKARSLRQRGYSFWWRSTPCPVRLAGTGRRHPASPVGGWFSAVSSARQRRQRAGAGSQRLWWSLAWFRRWRLRQAAAASCGSFSVCVCLVTLYLLTAPCSRPISTGPRPFSQSCRNSVALLVGPGDATRRASCWLAWRLSAIVLWWSPSAISPRNSAPPYLPVSAGATFRLIRASCSNCAAN